LAAAPAAVQGDRAAGRRPGRDADRDGARLRLDIGPHLRLPHPDGPQPPGLYPRTVGKVGAVGIVRRDRPTGVTPAGSPTGRTLDDRVATRCLRAASRAVLWHVERSRTERR